MNFLYPIYTEQTECQDCYKCVRHCPCKAIRVESGHAMVMPELCVLCGRCVTNCPARAKHVRDDLSRAKQLISLKEKVIVSLAPSFSSEFPELSPEQLIYALKSLGFWNVSETSIGADLVSADTAKTLCEATKKEGEKLFLSSACPAVVEFIKQEIPQYSKYIMNKASPLLAHARFLKEKYGYDVGIVFIGPCIAKKREADVWKEIDAAITFNDLRRWFEHEHILMDMIQKGTIASENTNSHNTKAFEIDSCSFIPERAAKGVLYPIDGGMIDAVKKYNTKDCNLDSVRMMAVSGINEIRKVLDDLHTKELTYPVFIEFLACTGGCINGPGSEKDSSTAFKRISVLEYADSSKERASTDIQNVKADLSGVLPVTSHQNPTHSEDDIQGALRTVGKYSLEDELNCACCGYDTCRDFACAMLDKRAEKTMCLSYMRKLAQKKANGLIQAIPSGVVICDRHLNIVECNKNFAKLMGDEIEEMYAALPGLEGADLEKITNTARFFADVLDINGPDVIEREVREGKKIFHVTVFAIEKEEFAGGVIEDITAPQVQRNRIMTQAKKVIDKNLSVVQKIAFLLGENAAETESILNSIIDSFSADDADDYSHLKDRD